MNNLKRYIDMAVRREIRRLFNDASVSGTANAVARNIENLYESLPQDRKGETGVVLKKAALLIKKVPSLHKKDEEDGADLAFDACNKAMDMLYKAGVLKRISRPNIDDLIDLVNR